MKKLSFYVVSLICIIFAVSSCQNLISGSQMFVFVVETENENDAYQIEYVRSYQNGKERFTTQIDTVGKIFYTHAEISHGSTGKKLDYLPVTIRKTNTNGIMKFYIIEYNRFKTLRYEDLPKSLKKSNNVLTEEDLQWIHENATYRVTLQPAENEKEVLLDSKI